MDYDAASQTVNIGAGQIWDDVYSALDPHGVNVVGGRVSGIGVAGFTLGGGSGSFTVAVDHPFDECFLRQGTPGSQINMA